MALFFLQISTKMVLFFYRLAPKWYYFLLQNNIFIENSCRENVCTIVNFVQ